MKKSDQAKYTILYARLSQEDSRDGVSNSIENQRMILEKYATDNGFENVKFLYDDGYSGTNTNRPAWKEVMKFIESYQVENLIIKDISRLTRDARKLSELIEDTFPDYNVRFISIGDSVDSLYGIDDFLPFRGLFHEMYAKDCSKKQRQVRRSLAERGERVATRAAFGYKKCADNPKKIEIDEEVAHIVKLIFTLCAEGRGPNQIANELSKRGYINPSNHYYNKTGVMLTNLNTNTPCKWEHETVKHILENEIYLGHTVSLKSTTKSFKDKTKILKPKEDWLRFENTHPFIIDQELWDIAHKVRESRKRKRKDFDEPNVYAGLVFCADCGGYLVLHRTHKQTNINSFACSTYKRKGKDVCSTHYISEEQLATVILDDIKRVTHFARMKEKEFIEFIAKKSTAETRKQIKNLTKELEKLQKRNKELDSLFKKLFENHVIGQLPAEMYRKLSDEYLAEQKEIQITIPKLEDDLEKMKNSLVNSDKFIERAKKYTDLSALTPEILRAFVDKIIVHDKAVRYSRTANQKIEIYYRDIGYLADYVKEANEKEKTQELQPKEVA
ncbi:MAG: recombinase family protein [Clostridia bacterium]